MNHSINIDILLCTALEVLCADLSCKLSALLKSYVSGVEISRGQ
jgi:hypothetical protein